MGKRKKDASKAGLPSSHVEGQGTSNVETGITASSARHKKKK